MDLGDGDGDGDGDGADDDDGGSSHLRKTQCGEKRVGLGAA